MKLSDEERRHRRVASATKWRKSAKGMAWRLDRKDTLREQQRGASERYYATHADALRDKSRRYRAENPEQVSEGLRQWRAENPDAIRNYSRKVRARNRGARVERYDDLTIFERDRWVCQLCHKKVNQRLKWPAPLSKSLDHIIPLSLGGVDASWNVQLAHLVCNMRKHANPANDQTRLL